MNVLHKLQYISQGMDADTQWANISRALDNGVNWIQLRWKNATPKHILPLAEKVKKLCEVYQASLIINDDILIAQHVEADGVHLGLQDDSIAQARSTLGENKIIGGTANTMADVKQRVNEGCDYIGLGPYRHTITKEKLSPILGIQGYKSILTQLHTEMRISIPPLYAIGGIRKEDVQGLLELGVHGIAISQVITMDPTCITDFKQLLA